MQKLCVEWRHCHGTYMAHTLESVAIIILITGKTTLSLWYEPAYTARDTKGPGMDSIPFKHANQPVRNLVIWRAGRAARQLAPDRTSIQN